MHSSQHLDDRTHSPRLPLPPPQLPSPWPTLPICTIPLFPYIAKPSATFPEGHSAASVPPLSCGLAVG